MDLRPEQQPGPVVPPEGAATAAKAPPHPPVTRTEPQPVVSAAAVLREPEPRSARWVMIRDLMVFQGKLFIDGLKDLVLGPLTLVAGIADLFAAPGKEGRHLYRALRQGRDFEEWLNLFEPIEREEREGTQLGDPSRRGLDAYVQGVEKLLVEQVKKGGMTKSAKDALDGALDNLRSNAMLGDKWQAPGEAPTGPVSPEEPRPGSERHPG